jgi:hypothetical protein
LKRFPESRLGTIRNITFENIIGYAQGTSKIEGNPDRSIENIKLSNVQIFMEPESLQDKRATQALSAHHVKNLSLFDLQVYWNKENPEPAWTNALLFEQIQGLRLDKLSCSQAPGKKGYAIDVRNSEDVIVERCYAQPGTDTFLSITGETSRNIILDSNYIKNAIKEINLDKTFNTKELHFTSKGR